MKCLETSFRITGFGFLHLFLLSYQIQGALSSLNAPPLDNRLSSSGVAGVQHVFSTQNHNDDENMLPQILDDEFDSWIAQLADEWSIKGIGIAIVRKVSGSANESDSWAVETKGYGIMNSKGDPVTNETLWSICSNSKLFAGLAVAKLVEDQPPHHLGNTSKPLTWTSRITDILPSELWGLNDPIASRDANLLDILSHRSGLPRHDFAWHRNLTSKQAVSVMRHLKPSTGFRELWQYNNWMYIVASEIISHVSGINLPKYIHQHILSKLPFSKYSGYDAKSAIKSGLLAEGFAPTETRSSSKEAEGWTKTVWKPVPFFIDEVYGDTMPGPVGIVMNIKDAAVWLQTLLLEGRNPKTGEEVMSASSIRRAASGLSVETPNVRWPELSNSVYGIGQSSLSYQGHRIVEHTGGWIGWRSVISRAPDDGVGIAVFTNWNEGWLLMDTIKFRIYEKALGLRLVDWNRRMRSDMERRWKKQDMEASMLVATLEPLPEKFLPKNLKSSGYLATYSDPGYGTFELCAPTVASDSQGRTTSDTFHYPACRDAQILAQAVAGSQIHRQRKPPVFIAAYDNAAVNYYEFHWHSGSLFNVSAYFITPSLSSSITHHSENISRTVIPHSDFRISAEFVPDEREGASPIGVGWKGLWGPGEGIQKPECKDVRECSEVWFDRV